MMDRWQTENIHSFSPKAEAVDEFLSYKDAFMKDTVWQQECRSWYKSNSITGKVTALWPGSSLHYLEAMMEPRYEDWDIKYSGNRFSFLGNGFSQTEVDPTADRGYYLRNEDDGQYLSRGKRRKVFSKAGTWTLDGPVETVSVKGDSNGAGTVHSALSLPLSFSSSFFVLILCTIFFTSISY